MLEKSKKILVFSTAFRPFIGGSEIAIEQIAQRLSDYHFDIVTACLDSKLPSQETFGNVTVYRVGGALTTSFFLLPKNFLPLSIARKALQLLRENSYDALHAYEASQSAGAAWLVKWLYPNVPFILTLQEGKDLSAQPWLTRFFRRLIFTSVDRVTVISGHLQSYVSRIRSDTPDLIPNGVDVSCFSEVSRDSARTELGIPHDHKAILTVSRLVEKNGVDTLLRACSKLDRTYLLLIAGDGPLRTKLEHLAGDLGIQDHIRWLGSVPHEQIPKYYAGADVFVRPSRSEGLGSVFLEAMAAGVPIVAPAVGGITDFLQDEVTGLACDSSDPSDVASKIERIFNDPVLAQRLAESAFGLVENSYTWDLAAQKMNAVYLAT